MARAGEPGIGEVPRLGAMTTEQADVTEPGGNDRVVRIGYRFRGPARSGNGGYTAGLLGAALGPGPVQVTLRKPPPLETDLTLALSNSTVAPGNPASAGALTGPDGVVADAELVDADALADALADPVPVDEARAAEASYRGLVTHPFPSCFGCGPDNPEGLRLRPGLLEPGYTACVWTPAPDLATAGAGAAGLVGTEYVWAALDCPGGWTEDLEGRPMVLGRITAAVDDLPRAGSSYVITGRLLGEDGRKTFTATNLYDADGRLLARARHTWIAVDPSAFE